jgi:hypothetical protein
MLRRLKVPIYDIKTTPPNILKGCLDHNLHVLIRTVGLDHSWLPFLYCRTKALFVSFPPPPLNTTLITPHMHSPLLKALPSMFQALSKSLISVLLRKKRPSLALLVLNAMKL